MISINYPFEFFCQLYLFKSFVEYPSKGFYQLHFLEVSINYSSKSFHQLSFKTNLQACYFNISKNFFGCLMFVTPSLCCLDTKGLNKI